MSIKSIVVDKKAKTVVVTLDYLADEPLSSTGKLRALAKSDGGFEKVSVDGVQLSANIFVGRKP